MMIGGSIILALVSFAACGFDTAGAWVTGTRFAYGANKDRKTAAPSLVVRFEEAGRTNEYGVGVINFKGRHWLQRRFTSSEQAQLTNATCLGFAFKGTSAEDEGLKLENARLFTEDLSKPLPPFSAPDSRKMGFPIRESTILPLAASRKAPLPLLPQFSGGAVKTNEAPFLVKKEHREGRCLIVDLEAPAGKVTAITTGAAVEAEREGLIRVPFLPSYGEVEQLKGGVFRSAWLDWYHSNASVVRTNANGSVTALYYPKTDGSYNPVHERIVVTLSDDFDDVLPDIPNPPSPYKKEVGALLWRSHASSNRRARDKAFWQFMHDKGIRKVAVMDHETMWRNGGEAFTFVTEAAKRKGGDEAEADYAQFMSSLGYLYGPYNNYTDLQPCNTAVWNGNLVARKSDGNLLPAWLRSYTPKSTVIVPLCEQIVPKIKEKFGFRAAYCDVHTSYAPWAKVDYDARCPGAGTFAQVYYDYGALLLKQRELWQGPVWSEGGMHFLYAGLVDGNYGQDQGYDFLSRPWLVDFDLLKLHPLETDFGMGSLSMFSPPKTADERAAYLPGMPEGQNRLVDAFLAATVAFGHSGLLLADGCWKPAKMFGPAYGGPSEETFGAGLDIAERSYFMLQALAARYTQERVEGIWYFDAAGRAWSTSDAIRNGAVNRRQLAVKYSGGVYVVVNGHARDALRVKMFGRELNVPSYGFAGWTADGQVDVRVTETHERRHYSAHCPDYSYDADAD